MSEKLSLVLADLEEQAVLELVDKGLANGDDPDAIMTACREGMALVGQRYETGEYFISDLMMAGAILKQVADILSPRLKAGGAPTGGKVVVGTVAGDIHDIGKDIVVVMLRSADYEVFDLGVDVPPQRFVDALKETGATVLGLSGLLTIAFDAMKGTVEAVAAAGLRPGVRVMIGGGTVNETVRGYTGADACGADAQAAVNLCHQWMKEAGR